MRVSLLPFPNSLGVCFEMDELTWALYSGQRFGVTPHVLPVEPIPVQMFIESPTPDPEEASQWGSANLSFLRKKIRHALISPQCPN